MGYYGEFPSLKFTKTGKQIRERVKAMREALALKIKAREKRITAAAEEANMSSAADVLLNLKAIAEGSSNAGDINMNVGIAAKVRSEVDALTKDRKEADQLRLVFENLDPKAKFDLNFNELTYFGF